MIFKSRSNFKVKVTKSNIMVPCEDPVTRNTHMKYESCILNGLTVMAKVKVFVLASNADARVMT